MGLKGPCSNSRSQHLWVESASRADRARPDPNSCWATDEDTGCSPTLVMGRMLQYRPPNARLVCLMNRGVHFGMAYASCAGRSLAAEAFRIIIGFDVKIEFWHGCTHCNHQATYWCLGESGGVYPCNNAYRIPTYTSYLETKTLWNQDVAVKPKSERKASMLTKGL